MENRIKEIFAAVFEVDVKDIHDGISSDNIENWDSLRHMNLIVAIEEEFDIQIEEEEIIELMSYRSIVDKVAKLI